MTPFGAQVMGSARKAHQVENVEASLHGVRIACTMATHDRPHTVSRMLPIAYGTV